MTTRAVKLLLFLALLCPWLAFADGAIEVRSVGMPNQSGTNTGDVTIGTLGAAPDAKGATISGQVLTLQPADATHPGVVTSSGAQIVKVGTVQLGTGGASLTGNSDGSVTITTHLASGTGTPAFIWNNDIAQGTYNGAFASYRVNSVEKTAMSSVGEWIAPILVTQGGFIGQAGTYFRLTGSDDSGTPGAVVQNRSAGIIAIAAGQSTVVLTDIIVASSSVVLFSMQGTDATCLYPRAAVPGSGSVTFTVGPAACTNAMKIGYQVTTTQ